MDRTPAARLTLAALRHAIAQRQPPPGVIHHSDQGVQYACAECIAELQSHGMVPSMSRPANPYDNAFCESFVKTLKQEEIYCNQYRDLEELSAHLEEFIGNYYNRLRLHSALGYRTPEEFERAAAAAASNGTLGAANIQYFSPPPAAEPAKGPPDPLLGRAAARHIRPFVHRPGRKARREARPSLMPQCHDGIDDERAPRGNVRRQQRRNHQNNGDGGRNP